MQVHFDMLGGVAGDMFIAALLDAFPEHREGVFDSIRKLDASGRLACSLDRYTDGVLYGSRFIAHRAAYPAPSRLTPASARGGGTLLRLVPAREQCQWQTLRKRLYQSALAWDVKYHAIGIFQRLAEAESWIHGVAPDNVGFHEMGSWVSLAEIVGAAHLITALGAARWTVSPLGGGRVHTARGWVPATAGLPEGFTTFDDDIAGERVTPTGAAILRHLCDPAVRGVEPRRLQRSGNGFGIPRLPGMSNCMSVLVFDEVAQSGTQEHSELAVIEFEVDDQSAEDLAVGLDHLRANPAIMDVVQTPLFSNKERTTMRVRVLARPSAQDEAIAACFDETNTVGLRHRIVEAAALRREICGADADGGLLRVIVVNRPGGIAARADVADARSGLDRAPRVAVEKRSLANRNFA